MSNVSLSAQSIKTASGLYSISSEFRSQFDQLMSDGVSKAKKLVADLSKLSLDGSNESVEKPAPKKRGRPVGSKNTKPSAPRAKKDKSTVTEPSATTTEAAHTHASAVLDVLTKEGLSAGEVYDAIISAKFSGYKTPEKKTLYTTLSSMKSKGLVNTKGERPNIKYIKP